MKNTPLVSLVIITMNHEKFIEQACQSAISQTYPHIEIILLDNQSNDHTFSIAKSTLDKSPFPVQLIENKEQYGVAKNLNILVSKTSGQYICILSGDDWLTHNSIEEKVKYLELNKLDFVISDGYRFYQDKTQLAPAYTDKAKTKIINSLSDFFYTNVTHNEPINVGVFIKQKLLIEHPFDEDLHTEDWDMNLRLTHLGYKIGFIDQKLFYYRTLSQSLSSNWELMQQSYIKVTNKYLDYIKSDNSLLKNYHINLIKYQFQKELSRTTSETERKKILTAWKKEKYKIRYTQPILFFKLLWLNFSA